MFIHTKNPKACCCKFLNFCFESLNQYVLSLQILEAFSGDDSLFVRNCSQLISQSDRVVTMPQYEFRQICDTKLESIRRRISSYQQVLRHNPTLSWRQWEVLEECPLFITLVYKIKNDVIFLNHSNSNLSNNILSPLEQLRLFQKLWDVKTNGAVPQL